MIWIIAVLVVVIYFLLLFVFQSQKKIKEQKNILNGNEQKVLVNPFIAWFNLIIAKKGYKIVKRGEIAIDNTNSYLPDGVEIKELSEAIIKKVNKDDDNIKKVYICEEENTINGLDKPKDVLKSHVEGEKIIQPKLFELIQKDKDIEYSEAPQNVDDVIQGMFNFGEEYTEDIGSEYDPFENVESHNHPMV